MTIQPGAWSTRIHELEEEIRQVKEQLAVITAERDALAKGEPNYDALLTLLAAVTKARDAAQQTLDKHFLNVRYR